MSKADKLFEELGYKKIVDDKYRTVYDYYGIVIMFKNPLKKVIIYGVTVREHLAIHEKMKELGWIIDGVTVREHLAIHEKMKELGWINV